MFAFLKAPHAGLFFICLFSLVFSAAANAEKECVDCHKQEWDQWKSSDHFRSMNHASDDYVAGNFNNQTYSSSYGKLLFQKNNNGYEVVIASPDVGDNTKTETWKIAYTFGFYPLQQYLIDIGEGKLQALDVAWDSRPKEDGGQRWYELRADENKDEDSPFYWKNHLQNWNSHCAECHSTKLVKNFDASTVSYKTEYDKVNVSCAACHGDTKTHQDLANKGAMTATNKGFNLKRIPKLAWQFHQSSSIALPKQSKEETLNQTDVCGYCHSRRLAFKSNDIKHRASTSLHKIQQLNLIQEPIYYADGQIRDEVFVLGSFLQSKMHAMGVTCSDCHNSHSGKLKFEENAVCTQCHKADVYDAKKHHHHDLGTGGSQCVDCHMMSNTYMGVDDRRDHRFHVPDPWLSEKLNSPLACLSCHEKDYKWAQTVYKKWQLGDEKSKNSKTDMQNSWQALLQENVSASEENIGHLVAAIGSQHIPILKASLLQKAAEFYNPYINNKVLISAIADNLTSDDILVLSGAITALRAFDSIQKWQLGAPSLLNEAPSISYELVSSLLDTNLQEVLPQLSEDNRRQVDVAIQRYRNALKYTNDFATSQVSLALLENALGNAAAASKHMDTAIKIDDTSLMVLLNAAEFSRMSRKVDQAEKWLARALKIYPNNINALYSMGILKITQQKYIDALPYFKKTISDEHQGSSAQYYYIYAVALENVGNIDDAVNILDAGQKYWEDDFNLVTTRLLYLQKKIEKANKKERLMMNTEIDRTLSHLKETSANNIPLQRWLGQFIQQRKPN